MNTRWVSPFLVICAVALASFLWSCDSTDYSGLYGYWQVDSIVPPYPGGGATGSSSEPWIKLSRNEWVTFVWYSTLSEWRHCTMRSGQVTSINGQRITFTQDYGGDSVTVPYTFDGTTFTITWPDDGEVYHMSTVSALPYTEDSAVSSPCFN